MKKMFMLGLLISSVCFSLTAIEGENQINKLSFVVAQKGEDLTEYLNIALEVFLAIVAEERKEFIKKDLPRQFAILVSWIGIKGKLFIKVLDNEKPVGFLTLEALDEEGTHVGFNLSPRCGRYLQQYLACLKEHFPNAKIAHTYTRSTLVDLHKNNGWVEDDSFTPNLELIPNFYDGWQSFSRPLD